MDRSRDPICDGRFFENDLYFWLKENLHPGQNAKENSIPWNVFFAFGIWGLCNQRNRRIFKQSEPNPRFVVEVNNVALNYFYVASKSKVKTNLSPIMVRWAKLEENWYKLNTDGSTIGNPSIVGGGGVVRDHNGQ